MIRKQDRLVAYEYALKRVQGGYDEYICEALRYWLSSYDPVRFDKKVFFNHQVHEWFPELGEYRPLGRSNLEGWWDRKDKNSKIRVLESILLKIR